MRGRCKRVWTVVGFVLLVGLAGCGPDEPATGDWSVEEGTGDEAGYDENSTVVVDPDVEDGDYVVTGEGEGCVELDDYCIDPEEARAEADDRYCDDSAARADVVVEDGEVVDVVCYPPKEDGSDIEEVGESEGEDGEGDTEIPQTENGSIVTFDEETDGEPIEGDVEVESERTTIYGNGVDETIVDGEVEVASNNSRVRSLTVRGDVSYDSNSNESALAYCKIHGDLEVEANGFTGMNCKVFGAVSVDGNDARLVNIGVQGEWEVNPNADCQGCYSFDDANDDETVQESEIGEELTCAGE